MNHNDIDMVGVVDSATDRPAFSDRGDSVVERPDPIAKHPTAKHKTRKTPRSVAAIDQMSDAELMAEAGVEPIFSTTEAAEFFDRSNQWLYWGLREGVFADEDGAPLDPQRIGDPVRGRRRFTLPIIKDIMRSSYRRGNIDPEHLRVIYRRIKYAERGMEWREQEGWHYVHLGRSRYRWVHPDECEWDAKRKEWKVKPDVTLADD